VKERRKILPLRRSGRNRRAVGNLTRLASVSFFTWTAAVAADDQAIKRAREAFRFLSEEKFEDFAAASDDKMREVLPAAKLKEVWAAVTGSAGKFERELSVTATAVGELTTVEFVCKFALATLKVRISLHKDGRVAGLFFLPGETSEYNPPAYADPAKFREEEVTLRVGAFELPGTLTLPKAGAPVPGVVLVHGSGPHDRDETIYGNKPFKDLAWGLATRGIAVIRYEKRTLKYGTALDPKTLTLDQEATDDALAAAKLLMERPEVDPKRVFILGHSLGAMAAPRAARKEPRIAGVILFAGASRSLTDLVPEQIEYMAKVDGTIDEAEQKQLDEIRRQAAAIRDNTWKPGDTLLGAPAEYWAMLYKIDAVADVRDLTIPVLIAQGSRDYQIPAAKDFEKWRRTLGDRSNVTLELFDGLDHLFRKGEGPSTPQQYQQAGHVDEGTLIFLERWIRTRR